MQQVFDRMRDAVLLLAARHPGKTVLLASHGCAIRNLLCWAHGWPIERLNDVNWGENTCVSVLEVEESGTPRLLLENDASHLPADCATLGKQDWWAAGVPARPFWKIINTNGAKASNKYGSFRSFLQEGEPLCE